MTDLNSLSVRDNSPYPEITVMKENPKLADQLSRSYAGQSSELSTITEYIYNSFVLADNYIEYAEIFKKTAIVEMHHLDILGRLILRLGGDPIFAERGTAEKPSYWHGNYISYEHRPLNILYAALKGEQTAYNRYISLARQCGDRYVFAVLTRIALDEMLHAAAIKAMISHLQRTEN